MLGVGAAGFSGLEGGCSLEGFVATVSFFVDGSRGTLAAVSDRRRRFFVGGESLVSGISARFDLDLGAFSLGLGTFASDFCSAT